MSAMVHRAEARVRRPPAPRVGTRLPAGAQAAAAIIVTAALALAVAACGPSTPSSRVATLDSPGPAGSPGASVAPTGGDDLSAQMLAYSQCMRDHGVPGFPDPQLRDGEVRPPSLEGTGIDQTSATFHAASIACESVMPTPPPEARQPMSPQDQAKWLQFSACVRSHGVQGFPDPNFTNAGPKPFFDLRGTGVDSKSATLTAAMDACRSVLPVINGGSGGGSSGSSASPGPTSGP